MRQVTTYLKKGWNWLTSMRTALVLLFLLALAALPGAMLPQRPLSEGNVAEYIANNGWLGRFYDTLGLYDVFSAPWFTAIYVLLMISLIGCIIPRTIDHAKAMRAKPVRAPKRLDRMPHYGSGDMEASRDDVEKLLKKRLKRWRVVTYAPEEDRAGAFSLAAERGYVREFFNLVFHLSLVFILVFAALGRLAHYEGNVIVVTGSGSGVAEETEQSSEFCNTSISNFDSFRAGPTFDGTGLTPFCFIAHDFTADYLPSGQAKMFHSTLSYASGDDISTDPQTWDNYELKVNEPLSIDGDRVYLQGHGYAPIFTVTWPDGSKRTQTMQFRPDDPTFFLSSGAMRFDPPAGMYDDIQDRRQHQLALEGLFAPTAEWSGENNQLLTSSFPGLRNPAVAIDIYRGDHGLDTGIGQSIFELSTAAKESGDLQKLERVNLQQGESITLDDGTELSFDGAAEYANFQVSRDRSQLWLLGAALVMLATLVGSLAIRRRRIWVRLTPLEDKDGHENTAGTHLEIAGIARTDNAGWGEEFDELRRELFHLPEPEDEPEDFVYHE